MLNKMLGERVFFKKIDINYFYIFAFGIVSCLLLIANPGYYSHDELQKLDDILQHGYLSYFQRYTEVKSGPHFGFPVRPFSFFIQGLHAFFINDYPIVVHIFGVLSHILNGCLFYVLLRCFDVQKQRALLACLIFIINPMNMLAVGWSAALMDRWYVCFGLLSLVGSYFFIYRRNVVGLLLVIVGASGAILSKETALILPALLLIFVFRDGLPVLKKPRFWLVSVAWFIPILIFLWVRFPAIVNTFSGSAGPAAYGASVSNVFPNMLVYFSFPLIFNMVDLQEWRSFSPFIQYISAILHLFVLVLLGLKLGFKYSLYYMVGFFIFLMPVLLIANQGSHYLYGSSLTLSLGVSFLFKSDGKYEAVSRFVGCFILCALTVHSFSVQQRIYDIGVCQNKINASATALYMSSNKPKTIYFGTANNAKAYESVLRKYIFGRNRIAQWSEINFIYLNGQEVPADNSTIYEMNSACFLVGK